MSRLTASSARLYQEFTGASPAASTTEASTRASGPTFIKVDDPLTPVDDVVELLEESTKYGRIANAWLRRNGNRRLARNDSGGIALEGKTCCMDLARQVDKELHRISPPKDYRCEVCGALWRVEMRIREDRRSGVW